MVTARAIWKTLASILGASCTSALLTFTLNMNEQGRYEKAQRSTVAILIASDLENFASQCSDLVNDYDDVPIRERGGLARHLPPLPDFRAHDHWKASLEIR